MSALDLGWSGAWKMEGWRLCAERHVRLQSGVLLATAPSILDRWIGAQKKGD
jgi:hypothetical protein